MRLIFGPVFSLNTNLSCAQGSSEEVGWLRAFLVSGLRVRILQPVPALISFTLQMFRVRWQISWRSSQASQLGHFLGQGAGHQEASPSGSEKPTHSCLRPRPLSISSCPTFWGPLEAKRAGNGRKWLSKFEARVQCFSVQCSTGILIETIHHGTVRAFQMFAIPSPAHCIRGVFPVIVTPKLSHVVS